MDERETPGPPTLSARRLRRSADGAAEAGPVPRTNGAAPWCVAVVDDDEAVLHVTQFALDRVVIEGRPITLLSARSAAEARRLIAGRPDIACALIDVVMETDHAGLDLVEEIRTGMANDMIRIILRTGQPGSAPPLEVIQRYQIDDYREKTELTRTRLITSLTCALRAFRQLQAQRRNLDGLRSILRASSDLMAHRQMVTFANGVVTQLAAHLGLEPEGMLCVRQGAHDGEPVIIGAAGRYAPLVSHPLSAIAHEPAAVAMIAALESGVDRIGDQSATLVLSGQDWRGSVHLAGRPAIGEVGRELLRVFCANVSLAFDNVRLFERVSALAYVDPVTGLSSRRRVEDMIDGLAAAGAEAAVLTVDIAMFATFNHGLGGAFGDKILCALARRIAAALAALDGVPEAAVAERIGRLYADVFCVVLTGADPEATAAALLERARAPIDVDGTPILLQFTAGIARLSDLDPMPPSGRRLVARAEAALKIGKTGERGSINRFTPDIENTQRHRAQLSQDLQAAIGGGGIGIAFQPQVEASNGAVRSAEALARWRHPARGWVSPAEFVSVAEAAGLIRALGSAVARAACVAAGPLLGAGALERISINVSPMQLQDPDCLRRLDDIVLDCGLERRWIEWEVTESAVADTDQALAQLEHARGLGYTIALDDFGTGYSSLSRLRHFPIDVVKIDRSFVHEITSDPRARSVLDGVVNVCRGLGLRLVYEGIESRDQLRLIDCSADLIQGYLFSPPVAIEALAAMAEAGHIGPDTVDQRTW